MILGDKAIRQAREAGDIVIEPFEPRDLGSDTYDVRLGEFFYREQPMEKSVVGWMADSLYILDNVDSVRKTWGEAQKAAQLATGAYIILEPGETILAHTQEFIGARRNYTTKMYSRSSIGRSMLGVCKCAGRGDVGYFNRWTFEITSFARHHRIPLRVGMRIAQIEFLQVGETDRTYGVTHGKYQDGADLEQLKAAWKPEMMLPRLHLDWELK